ncbi:MAG: hypothetical protein ACKVON_01855 [Beijerinckiaceae bacterium]
MSLKPRSTDRDAHSRVKTAVFEALGCNPDIAISVSEIICADPACPGQETVILVMAPQKKTAACKVSKAMTDVTEDDVRDALKQLTYTP